MAEIKLITIKSDGTIDQVIEQPVQKIKAESVLSSKEIEDLIRSKQKKKTS